MSNVLIKTNLGYEVRNRCEVTNQFGCNSCWAIAVCQTVSDHLRNMNKISITDQLNYYDFHDFMVDTEPLHASCADGTEISTGLHEMVEIGAPLMSKTIDRSFDQYYPPSDMQQYLYKVGDWENISKSEEMIDTLQKYGTVVAAININDSFNNLNRNHYIYSPSITDTSGMMHMISIIGYNNQGWIVRNSFGLGWGIDGKFIIPFDNNNVIDYNYCYAPIMLNNYP